MGSNIRGGPDNERVLLKIIVLGASAAGKTSL
jgi:GTPase SAR1 family protein